MVKNLHRLISEPQGKGATRRWWHLPAKTSICGILAQTLAEEYYSIGFCSRIGWVEAGELLARSLYCCRLLFFLTHGLQYPRWIARELCLLMNWMAFWPRYMHFDIEQLKQYFSIFTTALSVVIWLSICILGIDLGI